MKRFFLLFAVAAIAFLALFFRPHSGTDTTGSGRPAASSPSDSASKIQNPESKTPPLPPTEISHLADNLNSPSTDIRADLRIVADILSTFRTNFPHDGNPVGDNAEITAVLAGRNKLQLALIPPGHAAINAQGELCDRWGTPFFFHAESGTRMAVRSAGPDKKMWTSDDVVSPP